MCKFRLLLNDMPVFHKNLFKIRCGQVKMRMKMRNAELKLKGATVVYGSQPLAARLPELA